MPSSLVVTHWTKNFLKGSQQPSLSLSRCHPRSGFFGPASPKPSFRHEEKKKKPKKVERIRCKARCSSSTRLCSELSRLSLTLTQDGFLDLGARNSALQRAGSLRCPSSAPVEMRWFHIWSSLFDSSSSRHCPSTHDLLRLHSTMAGYDDRDDYRRSGSSQHRSRTSKHHASSSHRSQAYEPTRRRSRSPPSQRYPSSHSHHGRADDPYVSGTDSTRRREREYSRDHDHHRQRDWTRDRPDHRYSATSSYSNTEDAARNTAVADAGTKVHRIRQIPSRTRLQCRVPERILPIRFHRDQQRQ